MAVFHVGVRRIGALVSQTRHAVSSIDRGIRTGARVFKAVKEHIPDGKIKKAAEKGISSYEAVREKVRANAQMP